MPLASSLISADEILQARSNISSDFLDTPVVGNPELDAALGCSFKLKVETLNPVRSFKGRGTGALLASLDPKPREVVAASTGNFGQGLALAGQQHGIEVTIVSPANVNDRKLAAMRRLGAEVHIVEADQGDGKDEVARLARERGAMVIEDGAHREIAAGAGVIGFELTEAGIYPDILVIQIGDGALATGIASWLRAKSPSTRVFGVVPRGAPAMARSLAAGRAVPIFEVDTIADGMNIAEPIASSIEQLMSCIDEVLLVDDLQLAQAGRLLFRTTGIVGEPSGVAGIAAVMAHPDIFAGRTVAGVLTGGNASPAFLEELLAGDVSQREDHATH